MTADRSTVQIRAPISVGELIDKITILEVKAERIGHGNGVTNVLKELTLLRELKSSAALDDRQIEAFAAELKAVNIALWDIEDAIRELEARGDFGPRFIETARSVYRMNDRRAAIKRQINIACGSDIIEEKSYAAQSQADLRG
jgi:hypothetical protein